MRPSAWMLIGVLCAWVSPPPAQGAEERVEGVVRNTVVTHCDATRRGGCAGTLTLERAAGGKSEFLTVRVPLGTPISRGLEHATLGSLDGEIVIVTYATDGGGRVARAIRVVEAPAARVVPGPRYCDVC